jgi:competence protein ComEC
MAILSAQNIFEIVNDSFSHNNALLLNGMLFGKKIPFDEPLYNILKNAGILHIAVLSGANISIIISYITSFTSFLGKRLSLLLSIVTIITFLLFIDLEPPILRATVMGMINIGAILTGRRYLALYALFLSSIIMFLLDSTVITSLSFQLSVSATLGIILFYKKISFNHSLKTIFYDQLLLTISASAFTLPIIFYYFRAIQIYAYIVNMLIGELINLILLLGFLYIILSKVGVTSSQNIFYYPLAALLYSINSIATYFSSLPFASLVIN